MTVICILCVYFVCLPDKARNSTCPLARDKWIFRRTTRLLNFVVRQTTWIAAPSLVRFWCLLWFCQAWPFFLWSLLKQLLRWNCFCLVLFIDILLIRNAAAFSQCRPLSSRLMARWGDGGISRCYCADWLLSSCCHRISRSSGLLLLLSVSAAFAFSSCK